MAKRAIAITFLATGVVFSFIILHKGSNSGSNDVFAGNPTTSGGLFAMLNGNKSENAFENTNLTEKAATEIAAQIIEEGATMDGNSRALSADAISTDKIAERLKTAMEQGFEYEKIYESDLQIGYNNSVDKKVEYINSVGKTLSNVKLEKCGTEDVFMLSALAIQDFNKGKKERMNCFIKEADEKILNTLIVLSVPSDYKGFHLQLVNAWKEKISAFQALEKEGDPLKAYVATQSIQKKLLQDKDLFEDLLQKFKDLAS